MHRKIIAIVSALALGICGLTGCQQNSTETTSKEKIDKITIAEVTHSVFYAPQYVAISNGYFKEENLDIEITTGQGADKVMTAVLAGQSDIGFARTRSCNLCL